MDLRSQKNMAARLLGCGKSRVWFDPARIADVSDAITAEDVRRLINDGVIKAKPKKGLSSFRRKKIEKQKKKGRKKGIGSRKGRKKARTPKKGVWITRIRAIRKLLRKLKTDRQIDNKTFRMMYIKSKSGFFRNRAHIMIYLERNNLLKNARKESEHK